MKDVRALVALFCSAACVLVLGACSSGSSKGVASSSSSAAAPTSALAGPPIVVGSICSCSGVQATSVGAAKDVSKLWAESVNATGGINGHPVKLIVEDDGGNPATSLQMAKKLVEDDHVIAIVGDQSVADDAWASYVQAKGIPVVGGTPLYASFSTNPDFFASGATLPVNIVGTMALAKSAGKHKVGLLYCSESPICKQIDPLAHLAATLAGIGYTSASVSSTSPSYAAPCLAMKAAGVDSLFQAVNPAVVQRVAADCVENNFSPLEIGLSGSLGQRLFADKNMDGTLASSSNAVPNDSSVPGVKAFLDAVAKYNPGLTTEPNYSLISMHQWVAGKLFEAAAAAVGLTPSSTPADVKKGLYALKGETLDGLAPPLTFTPGQPALPACYFTLKISAGKFSSLNGGRSTCLTPTELKTLQGALGA